MPAKFKAVVCRQLTIGFFYENIFIEVFYLEKNFLILHSNFRIDKFFIQYNGKS